MSPRATVLFVLAALSLAACTKHGNDPATASLPPAEVPGKWLRGAPEPLNLENAPESIRALGIVSGQRLVYRRPGGVAVQVDIYRMKSDTAAFETQQKFRVEPGVALLRKGDAAVVCSTGGNATQSILIEFMTALDKAWVVTAG